jgi:hypothetical protein
MPTSFGFTEAATKVDGLYKHLHDRAATAAKQLDPRVGHSDFVPGVDAGSRRILGTTSKAAARRLASFAAGESQLVALSAMPFKAFPDLAAVPFLTRALADTQEEHDESAWLVRVHADDRVEVGQTRAQMQEQARLVSEGFTVGRIDADGDYSPRGLNPETGKWQDITPDDSVVFQ